MTYRELIAGYINRESWTWRRKNRVEAEIEKQDAISEFLYEEGEIPDFSDLENGQGLLSMGLDDKNQKAERQDSKIDGSIEERQGNQPK